jgi:sterol desaturase/sphingolipid hydroxylase (fatty acid hydroxylase superfamily)
LSSAVPVLGAFLCAATIEVLRPWRPVPAFALTRWLSNFALFLLAIGLNFLLVPVIAIAAFSSLNSGMYPWVQLVVGVLALDALSYALHRAFHASPILWRFHALHHSDPELDVSTTVRHHPGEALLMAFAVGIVAGAAGLSPFVIGLYASLNLGVQFFAHANVGLPSRFANTLAWLVITPVVHRVRHSRHPADIATNYGLVFSVRDRLLGTYRSEPEYGEDAIEFGIDRLREPYFQRLDRMLCLPFFVRENI